MALVMVGAAGAWVLMEHYGLKPFKIIQVPLYSTDYRYLGS